MELKIEIFDLGEGDLDAYYDREFAAMAVHRRLSGSARRARELEGHGHHVRPPRSGRKFCFRVRSLEDLDRASVRAIRRVVDRMAPEDVSEIKEARRISGDPRWISAYCDIDIQEVVAVLENLNQRERGFSGL